jgi:hypothetical protein
MDCARVVNIHVRHLPSRHFVDLYETSSTTNYMLSRCKSLMLGAYGSMMRRGCARVRVQLVMWEPEHGGLLACGLLLFVQRFFLFCYHLRRTV